MHQDVRERASYPLPDPVKQGDRLHPIWAVVLLLWMSLGLGVYMFNMLTLPGRVDRLMKLFHSLLK